MRAGLLLLLGPLLYAETVEILRDSSGTPHIFAQTAAGAAFGAGYAQAEDRPEVLLRNLSKTDDVPEPMRAMLDAFAAGVNRALGREAATAANVAAYARNAFTTIEGSGDFILGPERTGGDGVIAVIDPYSTWAGDGKPYEMRLYFGDRAISGLAPVGVPFPLVGHTKLIAVGWSGTVNVAGPRALEEVWALWSAGSMHEARAALTIGAIPGDVMIGTAAGEIFDSASTPDPGPQGGYVLRTRASKQADTMIRRVLYSQHTWPLGRVAQAAFSAEVWGAEEWQKRLVRADAGMPLVQMISGWNRRAEVDSVAARAFYMLKMDLRREADAVEPPTSLSDARLRASLDRVRDAMARLSPDESLYGAQFRVLQEGAAGSYSIGGGLVSDAAMETPRAIRLERRGATYVGVGGQTATQIVHLGRGGVESVALLKPGLPGTKPSYFGNRRELEKNAVSKKQLIF